MDITRLLSVGTEMMKTEHYRFLKDNIEPLNDSIYGPGYRAAAYLTDGTYLPCVIFRNAGATVKLAIRRFKEEMAGKGIFGSAAGYYEIVKNFVTRGNCVNEYDIDRVEESANAIPVTLQQQIRGETTMGWTGFAARMIDGKFFAFGTTFGTEFFDMPDGYSGKDVIEIINHSYVSAAGVLKSHRVPIIEYPDDYKYAVIYRQKPFFECFTDSL